MKIFFMVILATMSLSTFALETDYTCSLTINGEKDILKVNALIARSGFRINNEYIMIASNNFGYELEVIAYDKATNKRIVFGRQKLNGILSHLNPEKLQFKSHDELSVINCVRADNIEYPKD